MSLDIWLKRGRKVSIGGREFVMMPLPLSKLFAVGDWIEENSNDIIRETIKTGEPGKLPNPMVLVTRVLSKVDMSQLVFDVLSYPKDPDTRKPVNETLTKEFVEEYLDIPAAHDMVKKFVELNELEEIIKNLQSLPVVKKLAEAASLTFGIPFLNSLQQNTVSSQQSPEGSPSPKSTDLSKPIITERPGLGTTSPVATGTLIQ